MQPPSGTTSAVAPPLSPSVASNTPASGAGSSSNSPSTGGAGTGSNGSGGNGSGSEQQPPKVILQPVVPPTVQPSDPTVLQPAINGSQTFRSGEWTVNPSEPFWFAHANITYRYLTVILPHSDLLTSINCTKDGFLIDFAGSKASEDAYNFVKTHWPQNGTDFILATKELRCTNSTEGQYAYWFVDRLEYEDGPLIVHVIGREIHIHDVLNDVSHCLEQP